MRLLRLTPNLVCLGLIGTGALILYRTWPTFAPQWLALTARYPDAKYLVLVVVAGAVLIFLPTTGGKSADDVSLRQRSSVPRTAFTAFGGGTNGRTNGIKPGGTPADTPSRFSIRDAAKVVKHAKRAARPTWAAEGLFGTYCLSILSAFAKTGKTYAVVGLLRAMQDGAAFFGLPTMPLRVLYCTEQNAATFGALLEQFGVTGKAVHVLYRGEVRGWDWPALVRELAKQAKKRQCRGIVIDTLAAWCPSAELGTTAVEEALGPLQALTAQGYAVLLVHHDRKAGGAHGTGLRGHGALAAAVDVLLSLERGRHDDERVLVQSGRYGERRLVARLEGVRYVPVTETARRARVNEESRKAPLVAPKAPAASLVAPPKAKVDDLAPERAAILSALETLPRLFDAPGVPFMVLQRQLAVSKSTLYGRLVALQRAGHVATTEQRGVKYWHRAREDKG